MLSRAHSTESFRTSNLEQQIKPNTLNVCFLDAKWAHYCRICPKHIWFCLKFFKDILLASTEQK